MKEGCWVSLDADQLEALYRRLDNHELLAEDYTTLRLVLEGFVKVAEALERKEVSLSRLRRLLFGAATEKTSKVLGRKKNRVADHNKEKKEKKKPKGHGRNGAEKYTGAKRIPVPHETLSHGCRCPACGNGKVYKEGKPRLKIWITGGPILNADCYEREAFRCNLCGETFVAELPEGVGDDKYDESAVSALAVVKYGTGLPFSRLERFQESLGVPVPSSTQWDLLWQAADRIMPVFLEMLSLAAQGDVFFTDDTGMKLLSAPETEEEAKEEVKESEEPKKTRAVYTTGIVSVADDHKIALYATNRKHAGESFEDVLEKRDPELEAPVQMSDGLSRNIPKGFKTKLSNCLAHARRKFVDVVSSFPDEVKHVLETIEKVYKNESFTREKGLSPTERLAYHKKKSKPLLDKLKEWFEAQFAEKRVEPNSNLGKAIKYMLNRWEALTLFLRQPGAPLDNNEVERCLKLVVLSRKNCYFYRSERGALVGDLFMSMIQTSRLCGANPYHYITCLLRHADKAFASPSEWMPWNYKSALQAAADTS